MYGIKSCNLTQPSRGGISSALPPNDPPPRPFPGRPLIAIEELTYDFLMKPFAGMFVILVQLLVWTLVSAD